jgi:signal transduction histidine kinase
MLHWFRNLALTAKIALLLSMTALFFVLLLSTSGYYFARQKLLQTIVTNQTALINGLGNQLDDKLATSRNYLLYLTQHLQIQGATEDQLQAMLTHHDESRLFFNAGLLLLTPQGRIAAETPYHKERIGLDRSGRDYFIQALQTDQVAVSAPYRSTLPNQVPVIAFSVSLKNQQGQLIGILVGRHALHTGFLHDLAGGKIGASGYFYLINHQLTLLVHPDNTRILTPIAAGKNAVIDAALQGWQGTRENTNSRGSAGLTSICKLKEAPWYLAAHYPLQEAYKPLKQLNQAFGLLLLLAIGFVVVSVKACAKPIVRPLKQLSDHLLYLSEKQGDDRFLPVRSHDEIGHLTQVFNTLLEKLDQKHQELQTAFKNIEQAKREWEQTLDHLQDFIILTDAGHRIKRFNKILVDATGMPGDSLIGQDWRELLQVVGFRFINFSGMSGELTHARSGRTYAINVYPVNEAADRLQGFVISLNDTTELHRTTQELEKALDELNEAQSQIYQQEKMASIGQLAAGVAHEINNPMGFITSNLGSLDKYVSRLSEFIAVVDQALQDCCDEAQAGPVQDARKRLKIDLILGDAHDLIVESLEGGARVRRIVQDLKSFSRMDQVETVLVDLNESLETTINIAWNELKYIADLHREFGDIPKVNCFPQQLNQVFLNLLVNAAHALGETHGEITVQTEQQGEQVLVKISDTGCGMHEEVQRRIFEPFFTTKEVGKGTGLGLSISYDIIKKHGGSIEVQSEVGRGTTFTVRLPIEGQGFTEGSSNVTHA